MSSLDSGRAQDAMAALMVSSMVDLLEMAEWNNRMVALLLVLLVGVTIVSNSVLESRLEHVSTRGVRDDHL